MSISSKELLSLSLHFSFNRFFNFIGVWLDYFFSVLFKTPFVTTSPFSVSVETNTNCNLRCPECPSGNLSLTRNTGKINPGHFKKIIDEIYRKTFYLNLYLQGEPFLHPQLTQLVAYAAEKNMFVCISTNGHFLSKENCVGIIESGLRKIIISLDGASQETYEKYRKGGNFHLVTEGIKTLAVTKKELHSSFPMVVIQMIVNRYNEHEIIEMKSLVKKLGADRFELKTMQLMLHPDYLPLKRKHRRYYINPDGKLQTYNKFKNRCKRLWTTAVVTWDGEMASCCYDKNATYGHGNVFTTPFLTLWKSSELNLFRKRILTQRKEVEICRNCLE